MRNLDVAAVAAAQVDIGLNVAVIIGAAGGREVVACGQGKVAGASRLVVIGMHDFEAEQAGFGLFANESFFYGLVSHAEADGVGEDRDAAAFTHFADGDRGLGIFHQDEAGSVFADVFVEGLTD